MAVSIIPKEQGIWQYSVITTQTYGNLVGYYNTTLKIAFLSWNGNSTAPTAGLKSFTLPAEFTPKQGTVVPLKGADSMEVRTDGQVRVTLSTTAWSAGTVMYPLA